MKRRIRRSLAALLLAVVMIFSAAVPASAATLSESTGNSVNYRIAVAVVDASNAQILTYVHIAQKTPRNDVAWLLKSVANIAAKTDRIVEALGYDTECTYTQYYVDGQWVDIDPIRVIDPDVVKKPGGGGTKN